MTPPPGEGDEEAPGAFVAAPVSSSVPVVAPAVAAPGRRVAERPVLAADVAVATVPDAAVAGPRGPPLSPSV